MISQVILLFTLFHISLSTTSPISEICQSMMKTNPRNLVMSWYNEIAKLAKNGEIQYSKVMRPEKLTSVRSKETLVGDSLDGFKFDLSLWYKTWSVSRIARSGGPEWGFYEGGGMVYNGRDGKDLVYVYPDGKTCLVGRWSNGVMVEARKSQVEKVMISVMVLPSIRLCCF